MGADLHAPDYDGADQPGLLQSRPETHRGPTHRGDPTLQPHPIQLFDPPALEGDRADLPREADLPPGGEFPQRDIDRRRGNRDGNREIGSRVVDPPAPHDIHIDLLVVERDPGVAMEHREHLIDPGGVQAPDRPAGLGLIGWRHQGLDLDQDRAAPLDRGIDDGPRHLRLPAFEKDLRRVVQFDQPIGAHVEHAGDMSRPVTILDGAQHPEPAVGVALEIEDDVDHVLEQLGPGKTTLLGHVTDEDHRGAGRLRQSDQTAGALPHLGQAAGSRWDLGYRDRLDRIDDQESGRRSCSARDTMASTSSSATREIISSPIPSRLARIATCCADSSALAMTTARPLCATAPAVWRSKVDLPTPGSPPSRSTEPGTKPPPRTRSTSGQPVGSLSAGPSAASLRVTVCAGAAEATGRDWSSTKGSATPHWGQNPIHFGETCPHDSHRKAIWRHRIRLSIATARRENEGRHETYDKDDPGQNRDCCPGLIGSDRPHQHPVAQ